MPDGLMGYRTPSIDRIAAEGDALHRLLRRAELHGRGGRRTPGETGTSHLGFRCIVRA